MLEKADVYYEGWGEHWRWGTGVHRSADRPSAGGGV